VWINVTIPDGAALLSASEPWSATTGYRYTWRLGFVAPGIHAVSLTLRADGVPGTGTSAVSADLAFTDVNRNFAGRISASGTFLTSPAPVPAQTWIFLGLFALIAALSLFICYRVYGLGTRERAQVQQLFLLHKSGLLIKHYTRTLHGSLDSDILAAMLVAVQNLVRESFHFKAGDLEEMKFGSHKLLLAHGQSVILVAIVSGRYLDRLKVVLATGITRLESEFGDRLRDWDGLVDDFRDIDQVLDPLLHGRSPARNGNGKGAPNPRNGRL